MAFGPRIALAAVVATMVVTPAASADSSTQRWSQTSVWSTVRDDRIAEASGISRSTYRRSLVFLHNDSGDRARFFAVGRHGQTKAVFHVRHVIARDWEDMASGPNHTLWFGDIGNNTLSRDTISVVRVTEPRALASGGVRGRVFTLRYPDGSHNAEALMVRPRSGRVYVVTKSTSGGAIYRAPKHLSARHVNTLRRVSGAPAVVTGGDFAPKGRRFVLRTYSRAYLYSRMGDTPRVISLPSEHQGEAIGFTRGGNAVKLASEGVDQPIWRVRR